MGGIDHLLGVTGSRMVGPHTNGTRAESAHVEGKDLFRFQILRHVGWLQFAADQGLLQLEA